MSLESHEPRGRGGISNPVYPLRVRGGRYTWPLSLESHEPRGRGGISNPVYPLRGRGGRYTWPLSLESHRPRGGGEESVTQYIPYRGGEGGTMNLESHRPGESVTPKGLSTGYFPDYANFPLNSLSFSTWENTGNHTKFSWLH